MEPKKRNPGSSNRCWCSPHRHLRQHCMLMSQQLPLQLPFAHATAAAMGVDPVVGNQRQQRFNSALDILVQIELELECVEVTVHIIGAINVGLQHSLGYALSCHQ
ncbi:hypothetical protein FH972_011284 [Carpinus fangiana]|uniref:Uncharacterized protein n=1 Tax=Carpinus fangiana TaxID=176857 RepID=A0A660KQX2_9ROSI|nr:hypothetical protein FH972_011284 [Carpinus fangiana]